jgi:predicted DNA-binding ribbon-helix-helix protein
MLTINIILNQPIPNIWLNKKLTLNIDKEIISKVKMQNINLSSFLEIFLIDYLSDTKNCSRREGNTNLPVKINL